MTDYACVHQTPGTAITAPSAAYDATKPALIWYNSSGKTTKISLKKLFIQLASAPAVAVKVDVIIDTVDRYVSGGTAIVPKALGAAVSTTYGGTGLKSGATASTTTATQRVVASGRIPAGINKHIKFDFEDAECDIANVGSILVYIYDSAGANAPSYQFSSVVRVEDQ